MKARIIYKRIYNDNSIDYNVAVCRFSQNMHSEKEVYEKRILECSSYLVEEIEILEFEEFKRLEDMLELI